MGVLARALVVAISLASIALFDWPTFRDWVSYYPLSTIPFTCGVGAVGWAITDAAFRLLFSYDAMKGLRPVAPASRATRTSRASSR